MHSPSLLTLNVNPANMLSFSMNQGALQARLSAIHHNLMEDIFLEPLMPAIEDALLQIAMAPQVSALSPAIPAALEASLHAKDRGDNPGREEALLGLYLCLHGAGSEYAREEHERLAALCGIGNLPGGLTPLLMAAEMMEPGMSFVDLGSGNGLQGLLLQCIAPHALTVQAEISSRMIGAGRTMAEAVGLGDGRIRWVHGDIASLPFAHEVDMIYLYRPVKPHKDGRELYARLAQRIELARKTRYIVSVADCLGRHMTGGIYREMYRNEYLAFYGR